jgi:LmbE family N-acetylglucosaminyl deacetylase
MTLLPPGTLGRLQTTVFTHYRRTLLRRCRRDAGPSPTASCLVLAPHPDDETLGCGATILRKTALRTPVHIVFATDGGHSHRSVVVSPDALASLRHKEAMDASGLLGVQDDAVHFLYHEDGTLNASFRRLVEDIRQLVHALQPAEILAPSAIDGHADHRALSAAVRAVLSTERHSVTLFEYLVWLWNAKSWVEPDAPRWKQAAQLAWRPLALLAGARPEIVAIEPFRDRKQAALAAHRSQMENLTGEPGWATLDPAFISHFLGTEEMFFRISSLKGQP